MLYAISNFTLQHHKKLFEIFKEIFSRTNEIIPGFVAVRVRVT